MEATRDLRWYRSGIGLSALALLVAAGGNNNNGVELTLVAQNATLRTEIAILRETATVAADRRQIPLEQVGTELSQVQGQNQQLQSTLIARGFDPTTIANITPLPQTPSLATPLPSPTGVPGTPLPPTTLETPTVPAATIPSLANIVTASGVGDNDCALSTRSEFSPNDTAIYVVATASNIAPGMTLRSRWLRAGTEVAAFDFTPDFAIDNACVWFFIDQSDTPFTPGEWTVSLEINGSPAGNPATFMIMENESG